MARTGIQWTDAVWNPVTGCTKVSPGCKHCYAEAVAERFWAKQYPPVSETRHPEVEPRAREFTDVWTHPDRLDEPLHWRKPRRVFVNSMSDLFHEDVPWEFIAHVFDVMEKAKQHTFQVLTKRPERMRDFVTIIGSEAGRKSAPPNVWLGVSVENQETADERIPLLLQTPAVRFLSCEPLLEPINLGLLRYCHKDGHETLGNPPIDWVIVGGESGPGARPMDLAWARSIVEQCRAANVPCFVKQLGSCPTDSHYGPFRPRDRKGGDIEEFPADLRVREWPA